MLLNYFVLSELFINIYFQSILLHLHTPELLTLALNHYISIGCRHKLRLKLGTILQLLHQVLFYFLYVSFFMPSQTLNRLLPLLVKFFLVLTFIFQF